MFGLFKKEKPEYSESELRERMAELSASSSYFWCGKDYTEYQKLEKYGQRHYNWPTEESDPYWMQETEAPDHSGFEGDRTPQWKLEP
jgi:hypothetical protein